MCRNFSTGCETKAAIAFPPMVMELIDPVLDQLQTITALSFVYQ